MYHINAKQYHKHLKSNHLHSHMISFFFRVPTLFIFIIFIINQNQQIRQSFQFFFFPFLPWASSAIFWVLALSPSAQCFSLTLISSLNCLINSSSLGMTSKFISSSSPSSSSSQSKYQSQILSSINPYFYSRQVKMFLQQVQRGFSSNARDYVYSQSKVRSGYPQNTYQGDSFYFKSKIAFDFYCQDFLACMIFDHGSSPLRKYSIKQSNDMISSFLLGVTPLWYRIEENYMLISRAQTFLSEGVSAICYRVCASRYLMELLQSTRYSLPYFYPEPIMKCLGLRWLCTKFLKWQYCRMLMAYWPNIRTLLRENLLEQRENSLRSEHYSHQRTMKLQSSYCPHQCMCGMPIPPCMVCSILPSCNIDRNPSWGLLLISYPFKNNAASVCVCTASYSICQCCP